MVEPVTLAGSVAASAASLRPAADGAAASNFSTILSGLATDAVSAIHNGEQMAMKGLEQKASSQQVVAAVMDAERALQSAIAVRDKVVAAYQEISRMQI